MVRAILAGTKTQTRRIVKCPRHYQIEEKDGGLPWPWMYNETTDGDHWFPCPFGAPGDRLWVRETTHRRPMLNLLTGEPLDAKYDGGAYSADGEDVLTPEEFDIGWWHSRKVCPAIHMPRWASRITLEVTDVRVERLQDISKADAMAEGIVECPIPADDEGPRRIGYMVGPDDGKSGLSVTPIEPYRALWKSINGPRSWGENPWVWVVSFKRVKP